MSCNYWVPLFLVWSITIALSESAPVTGPCEENDWIFESFTPKGPPNSVNELSSKRAVTSPVSVPDPSSIIPEPPRIEEGGIDTWVSNPTGE